MSAGRLVALDATHLVDPAAVDGVYAPGDDPNLVVLILASGDSMTVTGRSLDEVHALLARAEWRFSPPLFDSPAATVTYVSAENMKAARKAHLTPQCYVEKHKDCPRRRGGWRGICRCGCHEGWPA